MIFFCNTYITDSPPPIGKGYVNRGLLKTFNNLDIFKYSLSSIANAYPWSKTIIYYELDEKYRNRESELLSFIEKEFEGQNLIIRNKRNEYQKDWKESYELIDDNLIWFYCNHDHIFIDSNSNYLKIAVNDMQKESEKYIGFGFSHFPESMRTASTGKLFDIGKNYCWFYSNNHDSIQIITKELYKNWWFEGEFNNRKFPRPDYFGLSLREIKNIPEHKLIHPYKEICRHFDGYQHIFPKIENSQCPSLEIPPGFFDDNIKIRYGYDDYKENWVNINPLKEIYRADSPYGTDYKITLADIPLCWQNKISEIDENPINHESAISSRIKAVLEMVYTSVLFDIPEKLEEKIVENYLMNYEGYEIDNKI